MQSYQRLAVRTILLPLRLREDALSYEEPSRSRFKETLRKELKRVRGKATEVSVETGISETTLSYWINDNNSAVPTAEKALQIARSLGVSLEYLITGDPTIRTSLSPEIERAVVLLESMNADIRSKAVSILETLAESSSTAERKDPT